MLLLPKEIIFPYKWSKQELLRKRNLALILGKTTYAEHYTLILNQLDLEEEQFKPEDILVNTKENKIDFFEALNKFSTGLEIFSDETYKAMAEIFLMIDEFSQYT